VDNQQKETIAGTSGYMPVEQILNKAVPASDIYSVGATMVHLLSGCHPANLPIEEMQLKFHHVLNVSSQFLYLLNRVLNALVEKRIPTVQEVLNIIYKIEHRLSIDPFYKPSESEKPFIDSYGNFFNAINLTILVIFIILGLTIMLIKLSLMISFWVATIIMVILTLYSIFSKDK